MTQKQLLLITWHVSLNIFSSEIYVFEIVYL